MILISKVNLFLMSTKLIIRMNSNYISDELYKFVNVMDQPDVAINIIEKSLEGDCALANEITKMINAMKGCDSFDEFVERINKYK